MENQNRRTKEWRVITDKEWENTCILVDELFPKGQCKERGNLLVFISKMLLIFNILPPKQ